MVHYNWNCAINYSFKIQQLSNYFLFVKVRLFSNTNSHKSTLKNIKSVRLYNLVIRDKEYIGVCLVSTMCLNIFFVGGIFATIPPVAHFI